MIIMHVCKMNIVKINKKKKKTCSRLVPFANHCYFDKFVPGFNTFLVSLVSLTQVLSRIKKKVFSERFHISPITSVSHDIICGTAVLIK